MEWEVLRTRQLLEQLVEIRDEGDEDDPKCGRSGIEELRKEFRIVWDELQVVLSVANARGVTEIQQELLNVP